MQTTSRSVESSAVSWVFYSLNSDHKLLHTMRIEPLVADMSILLTIHLSLQKPDSIYSLGQLCKGQFNTGNIFCQRFAQR